MSRDKQNIKTTDWLTRGMTEEEIAKEKERAIKEAEAELRDKQIEEMAKHCFFFEGGHCCTDIHISKMCEGESKDCGLYQTLENLHNAGYRKASEVAREIFEEIEKLPTHYAAAKIAELKKKYTEGKDNVK